MSGVVAAVTVTGKRSIWRKGVWIIQWSVWNRPAVIHQLIEVLSSKMICGAFRIWRLLLIRGFALP